MRVPIRRSVGPSACRGAGLVDVNCATADAVDVTSRRGAAGGYGSCEPSGSCDGPADGAGETQSPDDGDVGGEAETDA